MASIRRRASSSTRRSTSRTTTARRRTTSRSRSTAGRKTAGSRTSKTHSRRAVAKTSARRATSHHRGTKHKQMSRHSISHRVASRGNKESAFGEMYGTRSKARTRRNHRNIARKANGQFARMSPSRRDIFMEDDSAFFNYAPRRTARPHRTTTHRTTTHRTVTRRAHR